MSAGAHQDATDADLLTRFGAGEAAAARLLAQRLTPRVYGHAFRLLGDAAEAEDITQEALLRLWRQAPKWDPDRARISTWLYRVTGNLCIDRMRGRRPAANLDAVDEPVDSAPSAEAGLQQAARLDALQAALNTLPDRQRQAVILRHLDGLENPAIAEILETSVEAVESLTARAKRGLSAALAAQKDALGYDDDAT